MAVRPAKQKKHSLGKKAIFITLSSVLIVSLFLLYFSTREDLLVKEKAEMQELRVTGVNDFAENFEEVYLPRALFATAHRAIFAITNYMVESAESGMPADPYINLSRDFQQVMLNGTIYNESIPGNMTLAEMEDNTLMFWLDTLTNVSRQEMNIFSEFNISRIEITQTEPWAVDVTIYLGYNISSPGILDIVRQQVVVSTEVSIEGFVDPLIAVETGGNVERKINRSVINVFEEGGVDADELVASKQYIFQNKTAPSFIMRFGKNLNASSCCGIESLVDQDIYDETGSNLKSFVDYQYFTGPGTVPAGLCYDYNLDPADDLYNLTSVTTDAFPFKIDKFHAYEVYTIGGQYKTSDSCI